MNTIDRIRAEIERLAKSIETATGEFAEGRRLEQRVILSFLDTIEEETSYDTQNYTPSPSVDIGDVARVQFASHAKVFDKKRKAVFDWEQFREVAGIFYGFGKKDSLSEEPDKSLEEAAKEYAGEQEFWWIRENPYTSQEYAFKAGAEWQKDKDTRDMYMSDNRHFEKVYELGKKDMKAKMMEEAVDAHVVQSFNPCTEESKPTLHGVMLLYEDEGKPYLVAGDDTRIIILPKEDKK